MLRIRTSIVFLTGLILVVAGLLRTPAFATPPAQEQTLTAAPIIINFVSIAEDNPNLVAGVELFDGGAGETDLSELILVVVDEQEEPDVVTAISLEGFLTDQDGFFTIGGPEDSEKAEEQPFHDNAPILATHVGLLSVNARDEIDTAILAKELFNDLVILGNDSVTPRSMALKQGTQPLAVPGPITGSVQNGTIPSPCGTDATFIHAVQGDGEISPLVGEVVTIEGIVVGDFQDTQNQLGGFNLQEEAADQDGNTATSEGIFVFDNGFGVDVSLGDKVRVTGEVVEFFSLTEVKNLTEVYVCEEGHALDPVPITLPESVDGELEQVEGMLVEIKHEMTVAQNFFLGRYGQLTLSVGGRTFQPTSLFPAGSPEAEAQADENARRLLILDDGQDVRALGDNPDPVPYIGPPPPQVIRAGDTVDNLVGVIDFGRINSAPGNDAGRDYRLHPVKEPQFTSVNSRSDAPPALDGTLKIASFNVLNYFNGDGSGRGFPTPRGARNFADFQRQRAKLVTAIIAMEADIVGLMEIENDGYGPNSAIQDLVDSVNQMTPAGVEYAFIDPGLPFLGNDAIAVGMIYRTDTVTPVGAAATLDNGAFDQQISSGRSRQPLAQSFDDQNGERITVVVNHFKSKNPSDNPTGDNADMGPGIGAWNQRRTEAAQDLVNWLATDPTESGDPDILITGDLNAYGQETPIQAVINGGYINLLAKSTDMDEYTYVFDGQAGYLDHALASQSLVPQVEDAIVWHINTDEPKVIDYDSRFNPPGYYAIDPFRSSDHDPIIVGLTLDGDGVAMNPTPSVTATVTTTAEATAYPTVPYPTATWTPESQATDDATSDDGTSLLPPTATSTPEAIVRMSPTPTWTAESMTDDSISSSGTVILPGTATATPTSGGGTVILPGTPTADPTSGGGTVVLPGTPTTDPTSGGGTVILPGTPTADPTSGGGTVILPGTPTADPTSGGGTVVIPPTATYVPTASAPSTYVVARGDHLSLIARRYSVTIRALAEANGMLIHTPLRTGQYLTVPSPTSDVSCVRYLTAQRGDSLTSIIQGLDILPAGLAIVNGIPANAALAEGQQICIPDIYGGGYYGDKKRYEDRYYENRHHENRYSEDKDHKYGHSYKYGHTYGTKHGGHGLVNGYYVVQKGETLAQVAARFGVTAYSLQQLNGLKDIDKIYSGQYLKVGW